MQHVIVFLFFYFDSTQIRTSFIIFLGIFDSVCQLKLFVFWRFCYMDVIIPGFLDPSQKIKYRMKKLLPGVKKGPETFFPWPIMPRCHSFAAWISNTSLIKVRTAIFRVLSKKKETKGSNLQNSAVLKKIIIIEIFGPIFPCYSQQAPWSYMLRCLLIVQLK